jgi:hypothetical protein
MDEKEHQAKSETSEDSKEIQVARVKIRGPLSTASSIQRL